MDVESLRLQSFGEKNSYSSSKKGKRTRFFPKSQNKKIYQLSTNIDIKFKYLNWP